MKGCQCTYRYKLNSQCLHMNRYDDVCLVHSWFSNGQGDCKLSVARAPQHLETPSSVVIQSI